MTAAVLKGSYSVLKTEGNFNNLIGLPLTLFGLNDEHEWAVLELGMNHPGEIERLARICIPQIGVITNIAPGHLEGVKDLDGVMRAKGELLDVVGQDGTAVLNIDDERLCRLADSFSGRIVSFGVNNSAEVWATSISQKPTRISFDLCWFDASVRVQLPMPGMGAVYNALAAAAVGGRLGLSLEEVKKGLEGISPISGRMEVLTLSGGIHVINDTYNANPGSMSQAIHTLCNLKGNGRGIFVSGDMLELGSHTESAHHDLGVLVARSGISRIFATGDYAQVLAEGAMRAGMDSEDIFVGTKSEIVKNLKPLLAPGDWILVKGSRLMAMEKVVDGLQADREIIQDG
jgi:UDP-N-acetylmuramoyl-tripeptide--D-alanyl-D-alanine ligase